GPQLAVTRPAGAPWLATPLQTPSGAAILVVRGRTAPTATLPAPPPQPVQVTGVLLPSQPRRTDPDPDDSRVPALNTAQLVGRFGFDLYSGYVVLTAQKPASELPPVPPPAGEATATAGLRNLLYALQWWVFGGFVVFFWWRLLRDRARVA
ncbi:MAG: SURF1 family protein, partial [Actinomycetota bacterium]|nr:SURF1 family protein [Actinomycetota bacterium]